MANFLDTDEKRNWFMVRKETVQDELICLSRRDFSETSVICVFFSQQYGKISLLAKGVKRPRGKTVSSFDLLDKIRASFSINPDGLGLLREYTTTKVWSDLRKSIDRWYVAIYISELINISTKELEPLPAVYQLLDKALTTIASADSSEKLANIIVRFILRLLTEIGYKPELYKCVLCGRRLTPDDLLFFSASSGGIVCRDCEPNVFDKIRLEHRAWFCLLGKVKDRVSALLAFDILNTMLREHLGKVPVSTEYCRERIFGEQKITKL